MAKLPNNVPNTTCDDKRICYKITIAARTSVCDIYDCNMCFWYNSSCPHYPVPASPDGCPKVICIDPIPASTPKWLIPVLCSAGLFILICIGITARISCQAIRANERSRRHANFEQEAVTGLANARQATEQLNRDLAEIRARLGIPPFEEETADDPGNRVETIEDAMQEQDRQAALEQERQEQEAAQIARNRAAGLEMAARAERDRRQRSLRLRLYDSTVERSNEFIRRARARIPNINNRIRRALQEQQNRANTHTDQEGLLRE